MIFRYACLVNNEVTEYSVFAVVCYQDTDGVFIDRYVNKGKTKLTSIYMPYEEFNKYYQYGLWVCQFSQLNLMKGG